MATGGICVLKFSAQQLIVEIKTSNLGHWKVKNSFPIEITTSCQGCSELPREDVGSTAQPQRGCQKHEAGGKRMKRKNLREGSLESTFLNVSGSLLLNDRGRVMVALFCHFKVNCCVSLYA